MQISLTAQHLHWQDCMVIQTCIIFMNVPLFWASVFRVDFRHCIRLGREIFAQKAFDPFRAKEIQPGSDVQSDSEIDTFIRAKSDTAYHPSCTCKMGGASDKLAVVDPHCKVYGLESLRIVDASIMPSVITGNLNGPTVMIAEKASDIILGKDPLPKSNAPVYSPTSLDTQR